ncbi:hypothetical protein KRE43_05540 [Elizabethkingia meningoseptica]|uniref:hypothetical protein n=1 Tax=Elizabethkingia meningoseptica TaxID=238 RepID=UPI0008413C25|nr:hypothetical protein [Elizabethkingia meningoseptica]MDE5487308.1 hypothetical protein [Elizabethkingia meningoseptica]MDE5515150.1 hypothetical protein [Elizabethkingia meningoseptica]MDE5525887.1 hypothetical protein [Elizabethkingia meningoseptica]MDE5529416.1 hypothetical protein [Elizabethkingia meningoseptica]MDE5532972.1 hypothetical protein [Elizabethkingia meningoseptica]
MKNIDVKQVAIYAGVALLAYKLFNTKVSINTGLVPNAGTGNDTKLPVNTIDTTAPIATALALKNQSPFTTDPAFNPLSEDEFRRLLISSLAR